MAPFRTCLLATAITHALLLSRVVSAYPHLAARQIDVGQLRESYDYVIVGGGQAGIVIASRLAEDSSKTVLVVEYGYLETNPAQFEPTSATQYPNRLMFNLTSVAQPGLAGRPSTVYAASVVGGGSTINGMLFDRGSAEDYDNWEALGNPGWGFEGLLPYFKKATTLTPPDAATAAEFNITYDADFWGTDGPIQASYPTWQWPNLKAQFKAWAELGVPIQKEGASGKAYGAIWFPDAMEPARRTRSYAVTGYHDRSKALPNYHLLTGYRVNEVQFSPDLRAESVSIQARGSANGAATTVVKAGKEIVLCAGWLHSPHILQRSGVGPAALLTAAGIPVLVDLPGVGNNLQDHPASQIGFSYSSPLQPNPTSMYQNQTFYAWAQSEWTTKRTNKTTAGPLSLGVGNSAAMLPLTIFDPDHEATAARYAAQTPADFLPATYTQTDIDGYLAQRAVLLKSFASPENALIEIPFSGNGFASLVLEKPVSRGTVRISTADKYAEPEVDYNALVNPIDLANIVSMLKFARRWVDAPANKALGSAETSPGAAVSSDDAIAAAMRSGLTPTTAHGCCTSPMMPRDKAGVVGPDLLVYGVTGLSVADVSIMPLIPATHPCQTVYAIAEKKKKDSIGIQTHSIKKVSATHRLFINGNFEFRQLEWTYPIRYSGLTAKVTDYLIGK
ncbi:GMC oxidoreductase-domain-containing protein [Peziza echinospora]|nr:GMC oxidoreductase-domain-containing protein [Peziza echinospora]